MTGASSSSRRHGTDMRLARTQRLAVRPRESGDPGHQAECKRPWIPSIGERSDAVFERLRAGMSGRECLRSLMLASTAMIPLGIAAAAANPLAPNVVGGGATVSGVGTSNVTVNQSTSRAIINWNSFNIGAGETTRFVQPDA